MSEGVTDRILIEIDGQVWTAFESVSVRKNMQDLCGTFTFKLVKRGDLIPFANGAKVRILVGTPIIGFSPILTGYIEQMVPSHDAKSHSISVSGRDKTADVVDSTIGGNIVFNAPISLISLTKKTLKTLGITGIDVNIDSNVTGLTEKDLMFDKKEVIAPEFGISVFDFLSQYARKKQVILTTDENGNLLFTRTSNNAIKTKLVYKNFPSNESNVLSASGTFDNSKRYNKYVCASQSNPTLYKEDDKKIPVELETGSFGLATDDGIRSSRIYNFLGESPSSGDSVYRIESKKDEKNNVSNGEDAKDRAIWESNVRRAKSFYYNCTIIGYRAYEDNIIWRPNLLVQVTDDDIQVDSQLLINKISYSKDLSGSITTLELVSKDTFDLLQITGKNARKKKSERIEGRKFAGTT